MDEGDQNAIKELVETCIPFTSDNYRKYVNGHFDLLSPSIFLQEKLSRLGYNSSNNPELVVYKLSFTDKYPKGKLTVEFDAQNKFTGAKFQ